MKVYICHDYRNPGRGLSFKKGDLVELDEAELVFLTNDSPGVWSKEPPGATSKAQAAPDVDKQVKSPARSKRPRKAAPKGSGAKGE